MRWRRLLTTVLLSTWPWSIAAQTRTGPSSQATSQGKLGDRLLLMMSGRPFTQRHLESYLLVKWLIRDSDAEPLLIGPTSWPKSIATFRRDRIVIAEAERLGSFLPTQRSLDIAFDVAQRRLQTSRRATDDVVRLGLTDEEIRRHLADLLRLEGFRRSRNQQAAVTRGDDGPQAAEVFDPTWFEPLRRRAIIRHTTSARRYEAIHPATDGF